MYWRSAVRSDKNLSTEYLQSKEWGESTLGGRGLNNNVRTTAADGSLALQSFSGRERNKLFSNLEGTEFKDISSLSGLDTEADSRSVALWDFDHDGWQDIALINSNTPMLNIFRNQTGERDSVRGNFIAVRLHGGNQNHTPISEWSNRDGIGAEITAICGDRKYVRELRCGEGFAAQNSNTMLIGISDADQVDSLQVRWPSGKIQKIGSVPAGKLLLTYENPDEVDEIGGYQITSYDPVSSRLSPPERLADFDLSNEHFGDVESKKFRVYVATATWCPSCKKALPQLARLKKEFEGLVDFYGVPVDPSDNKEKLENYVSTYQPAYKVLDELTTNEHQKIFNMFISVVGRGALPSVFVLDNKGNVIGATAKVPTVSWLKQVIRKR